jgi:hypothetical protein
VIVDVVMTEPRLAEVLHVLPESGEHRDQVTEERGVFGHRRFEGSGLARF